MLDFFWYDLLYKPLYNALIFFYGISPGKDMGLAVIFLTVSIRVFLLPFSIRAARSEHLLERLDPVIQKIKKRYKYDIQKQKEAIKHLLRKNKIGIFSNFFSIAFQILIFVILYKIFSSGLQQTGHNVLYSFNLNPGVIDPMFFGWFNLIIPNQGASIFAGIVVLFLQGAKKIRNFSEASTLEKALIFGLPLGTYAATIVLPSAKAIFIATSALFSLWIRLIKWTVLKIMKDDELKENVNDLWTN